MDAWWEALAPRARWTILSAAAALLVALGTAAWWLFRPDPAVLFADLRPQDAAALGSELEKLKIPYTVADNGAALLVERSQVHAVRMKLMGRELPLHGTVGLELFNTTDFGMTEFAQKVNFQRALQGELTRTILSFPEVRDARVHLVLPEQGLFKQNAARAKAAITLALRNGQSLRAEQVVGIQRLVAAAVPALTPQEVTIVDQQGVPLTRSADAGVEAGGGARMELKRDMEAYLARKAGAVLDQAFGPGQALASVDVTLNLDQVRVTTEDVIAAGGARGGPAAGVLVRERESARDNAGGEARAADGRGVRGSSMQRDVEYQPGRRIEQVVSQPGAVRRLQVVAVVREPLEKEQQDRIEHLLAAAVGASPERGDGVVVHSLSPRPAVAEPAILPLVADKPAESAPSPSFASGAAALAAIAGAIALALLPVRRRKPAQPQVLVLTDEQRQATLQRLQAWLVESPVPATGARKKAAP